MAIASHIVHLQERKSRLEADIARELGRPLPDFALITGMKKQKLFIKEEMFRLSGVSEAA